MLLGLGMTATVQAEVLAAAAQYGIPGQVLVNLAQTESSGNQAAIGPVTPSGQRAIGVMQLMPDTAAGLGVDPTDEQQNIQGGAMYLSQMFAMFGNWNWAVAAYNCGPGWIQQVLAGTRTLPAETANYVQKILGVPFDPSGQAQGIAAAGGDNAGTLTAPAGGTLSTVQPVNLVTGQPVATGTPAPASGSGSSQLPLLLLAGGGLLIFALMD